MNKSKIILSAIGGGALLASLGAGYLIYSGCGDKSMKADDLEASESSVTRTLGAKIAPTEASVQAIVSNKTALAAWRDEALALASAGDFVVDPDMTPEALKRTMVDQSRELLKLGGGKIMKEDFGFGFKEIVTGGAIPERAKVPLMQRQWREIRFFIETLAEAGAVEIKDVAVVEAAAPAEPEAVQPNARKRPKKPAKTEEKADPVTSQGYTIKFLARPAALVKCVNAFATAQRFVVVDGFTFARERDTLDDVLSGGKDKDAAKTGGRRARRRLEAAAEAEKPEGEENNKKGLVTDPEIDPPFIVTLKLTTYDFGTAEFAKTAAPAEEAEAGASKEEEE